MNSSPCEVRIAVASPHPLDTPRGNTVTVRRIASILGELGCAARAGHGWDGRPAEVLVALHAEKSADTVRRFREAHPDGRVIVYLGGTDLYGSIREREAEAMGCLAAADRLVVSQEASLQSVPGEFRGKTRVVWQSVEVEFPDPRPERERGFFDLVVVGHLRAVKDPFLAVEVVHGHPEWDEVRVWQLGEELEEGFAGQAREWERRERRYRWLGELPREEAIGRLCRSAVMVNSSRLEGGSNAVAEALVAGTPVLASRVEGNVGILGEGYAGYFPPGDGAALAEKIEALRGFGTEWQELQRQGCDRRQLFRRERERALWEGLLGELPGAVARARP